MMTIFQNIRNLGKATVTAGLIGILSGCGFDAELNTFSIEQRGISPARPIELIGRNYMFFDQDSTPGMDHVIVSQDVVKSSVDIFDAWGASERYTISGEEVERLYQRVETESQNNANIVEEWTQRYGLHK